MQDSHETSWLKMLYIFQQCSLQCVFICKAADATLGHDHHLVHHHARHVVLGQVGEYPLFTKLPFEEVCVLFCRENQVVVRYHGSFWIASCTCVF